MTHQQKLEAAQRAVDTAAKTMKARFRQRYHFMPPAFWMNDPNGCIYLDGQYHLFYQHHPYSPQWGNIHWGHATSRDLVHWRHHPIALAPSEPYDDHPEGGVFSGSTLYRDGVLFAYYTGTANHRDGFVQTQCLATSRDQGETFQKYQGNPIITQPPPGASADFRDPRVLEHAGRYYMLLGSSLGGGAWHQGEGCAQLYRSDDLLDWQYVGIPLRSGGALGTMWECPDLFPLGGKWVMTFSPMFNGASKAVYLVGDMDFEVPRFTVLYRGELDWGGDWYAPQSMRDDTGRIVLMAWQNAWDWMPWWRDFGPTQAEGWCGSCALPRTVALDAQNRLVSQPVAELARLRGKEQRWENLRLDESPLALDCKDPVCFELRLDIDYAATTAHSMELRLRGNGDRYTRVVLDLAGKRLVVDRSRADETSSGVFECALALEEGHEAVRAFSDVSSLEVFADNGLACMSNTIYPAHDRQDNLMLAHGGRAVIRSLSMWPMGTIW